MKRERLGLEEEEEEEVERVREGGARLLVLLLLLRVVLLLGIELVGPLLVIFPSSVACIWCTPSDNDDGGPRDYGMKSNVKSTRRKSGSAHGFRGSGKRRKRRPALHATPRLCRRLPVVVVRARGGLERVLERDDDGGKKVAIFKRAALTKQRSEPHALLPFPFLTLGKAQTKTLDERHNFPSCSFSSFLYAF